MLNFEKFRQANPHAAILIHELMQHGMQQSSEFMAFISVWMSFNGWLAAVTEEDTDADMINAAAGSRRLSAEFERLRQVNLDFASDVEAFRKLWPVLNVRDVEKKLGAQAFWNFDHAQLVTECLNTGVKMQPKVWAPNMGADWDNVLRSIYQVRCNLFHGLKSPQNDRDMALISTSAKILRGYIKATDCFNWNGVG